MPKKRVFPRLWRAKEETPHPKIDAVLKDELEEAARRLKEFSEQVRQEMAFIEDCENKHIIPDELTKGED